jgi:hypothetical protein
MNRPAAVRPCVLCATGASNLVTGTAEHERVAAAPMCTGCLRGMQAQAAGNAADCVGCAVVSHQPVVGGGQVLRLLADAELHEPVCAALARLVLLRPTLAQAWARRSELSMAIMRRLRVESTAEGIRPMLFAYRDERLVAQIMVRPFGTTTQKERALREAAGLANAVRATQARLVSDVWLRTDLAELPTGSLADDPAARSALFALDWDRRQNTTTFELVSYQLGDDGRIVFDPDPLELPPGVTGDGRFGDVLREATSRAPSSLAVHLARRLEARGHGVLLLPSGPRVPSWPTRSQVEPRGLQDGPEIDL